MSKVMLVEDDNNLREIYEARLKAEGYEIISAKDGEEALAIAKAQKPDLIISDVMMPKISGFEMLDILRNTEGLKEAKVIMLTALGQSDDQQRADKLGADRYLVKSQVTLEDIVSVAHELLQDTAAPAATTAVAPPADASAAAAPPSPVGDSTSSAATPATPAPVPTPVVSTPMATPAPAPTPAPADPVVPAPAEPATTTFVAGATDDTSATPPPEPETPAPAPTPVTPSPTVETAPSTAQEEADVEAKIEDFVAGATTAAPVADAPPALVTPTSETETAAANTAADDKLMADAVNTLVSDSTAKPDNATSKTDTTVAIPTSAPEAPEAPAEEVAPPPDKEDSPTVPEPAESATGSVPIAHKKVISPIADTEPKKDITTLLALEEAKEAVTAPAPAPTAIIDTGTGAKPAPIADAPPASVAATDFAASKQPPKPDTAHPDPNSIAL